MMSLRENIELDGEVRMSNWRRASVVVWSTIHESQFRTTESFPAAKLGEALASRPGVTAFHFALKALAMTFAKHPEMNVTQIGKRIFRRKHINIYFHITTAQGTLEGETLREVDELSTQQIAARVRELVAATNAKPMGERPMPYWLIKILVKLGHFLCYRLNLWAPWMRISRDRFGCAMVSNIGTFGVGPFHSARNEMCHNAVLVGLGPIVADVYPIYFAFDHRLCDGADAALFIVSMREYFEDPNLVLAGDRS